MLVWFSIRLAGGRALWGTEMVADLTNEIFDLPMTYTVQKSGTLFDTVLGMSVVMNLL